VNGNFYDGLLGVIESDGTEYETMGGLNFIGVTIERDTVNNRLKITVPDPGATRPSTLQAAYIPYASASEDLTYSANFTFSSGVLQVIGGLSVLSGAEAFVIQTLSAGTLGFFGATPVARPTGVAVSAAAIHAALVSLGLIAA
jgi:hypothetical protein